MMRTPLAIEPAPMVLFAFKTLVGYVDSRAEGRSYARQPRVRSMPYGEEALGHLLVGGRSGTEAKARDDACGICGHEQTETLVPSQAIAPSNVCTTGEPSFTPAFGIPNGHRRAVEGLVWASSGPHHIRQMQGYLLDEAQTVAHQPVELRALGQSGESTAQAGACIAVEVPLAPEACPSGEDREGDDLAGAQGCIGSGVLFLLRARLAEVIDHNVECGEEGVHIEHESVPFPSGIGIGKPTLICGHLPLKFRPNNSHQAFQYSGPGLDPDDAGYSLEAAPDGGPSPGMLELTLNALNAYVPPSADGEEVVECRRNVASRTAWELHEAFA